MKYLYDHGVELKDVIGITNVSGNNGTATYNENEDNLYLNLVAPTNANSATSMYSDKFDLTSYKLMRAKVGNELINPLPIFMGVGNIPNSIDNINSSISSSSFNSNNVPNNMVVDIENVNGEYYLYMAISYYGGATTMRLTVTEWWLE